MSLFQRQNCRAVGWTGQSMNKEERLANILMEASLVEWETMLGRSDPCYPVAVCLYCHVRQSVVTSALYKRFTVCYYCQRRFDIIPTPSPALARGLADE